MPRGLDPIHQFARAADGDREGLGNVEDPTRSESVDDLHRLESTQRQVVLDSESLVDGRPQFGFEADKVVEVTAQG
ncbi:hypothetical protein GCM10020255_090480 [Rhodococcus baikonurensis]